VFTFRAKTPEAQEDRTPELYEQIGRLMVELDGVKKPAQFG
jgi:hypothetical protein